jgi:hypothetical protein
MTRWAACTMRVCGSASKQISNGPALSRSGSIGRYSGIRDPGSPSQAALFLWRNAAIPHWGLAQFVSNHFQKVNWPGEGLICFGFFLLPKGRAPSDRRRLGRILAPRRIGQHKHVKAAEQQQEKRRQRRIGQPIRRGCYDATAKLAITVSVKTIDSQRWLCRIQILIFN